MQDTSASKAFRRIALRASALPRSAKRLIVLASDVLAFPACAWLAVWLVVPQHSMSHFWVVLVPLAIGIPAQNLVGSYRSVVRFMGFELIVSALTPAAFAALALMLAYAFVETWLEAVRVAVVFWLIILVYVAGSRIGARLMMRSVNADGERVVIYGAGEAGVTLAASLATRREFSIVGFVDDNPGLVGVMINGFDIYSPNQIPHLIEEFEVSRVLLALPRVSRHRRQTILNQLERLAVRVQTMPDFVEIISGKARVDDIRDVEIKDLLGRDSVPPNPELLDACIRGKAVMVSGAGGSIGSELCLQIAELGPRALVLLDVSEAALYVVHQRVRDLLKRKGVSAKVYPLIGSVHHKTRMKDVLSAYAVDTVYHAAAYKHVPLVEHNMIEGIYNNVFGTLHTAQAAIDSGVASFVLVSTDKAVKPPNVMGATKRLSELILQALDRRQSVTTFSIVRFGNVLASSGSVVPLFREQIRNGGPVTVTHPEIYRYFMTIPEAASLVLQAGSMARGGDVFVLDMGESVRIRDLAEKMIHLMGLTIRDKSNPDGDIEIQYTGLRPAEKLYEELLIGNNVAGTEHPSILRAEEESLGWEELEGLLDELWVACQRLDCVSARNLLLRAVSGYSPGAMLSDLVWQERNRGTDGGRTVRRDSKVTPIESGRAAVRSEVG